MISLIASIKRTIANHYSVSPRQVTVKFVKERFAGEPLPKDGRTNAFWIAVKKQFEYCFIERHIDNAVAAQQPLLTELKERITEIEVEQRLNEILSENPTAYVVGNIINIDDFVVIITKKQDYADDEICFSYKLINLNKTVYKSIAI